MDEKIQAKQKALTRQDLEKQVAESRNAIAYAEQAIASFTKQKEQQQGVLLHAEHLLKTFDIPSEAPVKAPDSEVK